MRPVPPGGRLPIEVGRARARALLAVVARHADVWNVNWPPIPARVEASAAELAARLPRGRARPPDAIRRRLWIFTRAEPLSAGRRARRVPALEPVVRATSRTPSSRPRSWSGSRPSAASGSPRWPRELDLEMPVLDLSGLDAERAREALEALPAGELR